MRVLILGGDGYLGWPTAMHFASKGHEVSIVDSYIKRDIENQLNSNPLCPVPKMVQRCKAYQRETGNYIQSFHSDITKSAESIVSGLLPDVIIHYAEQPSAPYSMIGEKQAEFTLLNNVMSTFNLAWAVMTHKPDCHIIKLGTMGEYGTPNIDIEEGFIDIEHNGRKDRLIYPRHPGTLYHTSKVMDTDLLHFYSRIYGLRVTDLMQGPVYGIFTPETELHPDLITSFHYDDVFGTVINRFVTQAVAGQPLTVYGEGEQTRGYIDIRDTIKCVELAANNPAQPGKMEIYNQFTDQYSINDLAEMVKDAAKELSLSVDIQSIENPRKEQERHFYNAKHSKFIELGHEPNKLDTETLRKMIGYCLKNKNNINDKVFTPRVSWS